MIWERITACFQLQRVELVSTSSLQKCRWSEKGRGRWVREQRGDIMRQESCQQVKLNLKSLRCLKLSGCDLHSKEMTESPASLTREKVNMCEHCSILPWQWWIHANYLDKSSVFNLINLPVKLLYGLWDKTLPLFQFWLTTFVSITQLL